jgi:DNA-binding HxlR family transcriptional regulator
MKKSKRTYAWESILRSLGKGDKTMKELVKNLRRPRTTIASAIGELRKKKLVKKIGVDKETKSIIYGITQRGKEILRK